MSGPHKKGGHEEGGGHAPMWIVSFADMVILLMSFFVLLLCQGQQKSTADEDLLKILASIKLNFGYAPRPDSKDPIDIAVMQVLSQKQKGGFSKSGQKWRSPAVEGQQEKKREQWVKAQSQVGMAIKFGRDSADILDSNSELLEEIAEAVRHHFRDVIVQGHCTAEEAMNDPLEGDEIAFHRAMAVKRALVARGVAARRLYAVSLSNNASVSALPAKDRQVAIVTIGSYFLPSDKDIVSDGTINTKDKAPAKPSAHGGH